MTSLKILDGGVEIIKGELAPTTFERRTGVTPVTWTHFKGTSIGVHDIFEDVVGEYVVGTIRITAGVYLGANTTGGVRFDSIVVDFGTPVTIPPRKGLRVVGNKVIIDSGTRGAIPPRGTLRFRYAYHIRGGPAPDWRVIFQREVVGRLATRITPGFTQPCPTVNPLAGKAQGDQLRAIQTSGVSNFPRMVVVGPYAPFGEKDHGAPGGVLIDFCPGFEGSCEYTIERADRTMDRERRDCLDPVTGKPYMTPRIHQQGYTLTGGGIHANSELPDFTMFTSGRLVGRYMNGGPSPYEEEIGGQTAYSCFSKHNDEHLRRSSAYLEAAIQHYDDATAAIDIASLANDIQIAYPLERCNGLLNSCLAKKGKGHDWVGSRACSWIMDTLNLWRPTQQHAQVLASAAEAAIMNNNHVNRRSATYPYSPSPLTMGIRADQDVDQIMELVITAYCLLRAGKRETAIKILRYLFIDTRPLRNWFRLVKSPFNRGNFLPKYAVVGVTGQNPAAICQQYAGGGDYFQWVAGALGAIVDGDPAFVAALCKMSSPTNGNLKGVTPAGTVQMLVNDIGKEQTALAMSVLQAS